MSGHDARTIEAVLAVIAEQRRVFASDEYATPQPLGGFKERFACDRIADELRALPIAATPADGVGRVTAEMVREAILGAANRLLGDAECAQIAGELNAALAPAPDATDALRVENERLRAALGGVMGILERAELYANSNTRHGEHVSARINLARAALAPGARND